MASETSAACFIDAAGVDPDIGDTSLVDVKSDALLSAQSSAVKASKVLEGDFALSPGVRKYGVGWRFSHGLFEFHGVGIDQSRHDGMIKRSAEKLGQS